MSFLHTKGVSALVFLFLLSACAKQAGDPTVEQSKLVNQPDIDTTGDTISTYSGTFHLETTLNEGQSSCDFDDDPDGEKEKALFASVKKDHEVLNCVQANTAFQCTVVSKQDVAFKGEIKDQNFKLTVADQSIFDSKEIDYGDGAQTVLNLFGKFYDANMVNEAELTYVQELTPKGLRKGKKCKVVWDARLYRDKNDESSTSPPVLSNINIDVDHSDVTIETVLTDEDSDDSDLTVWFIQFEKSKAPAQDKIDWSKATKYAANETITLTGLSTGEYTLYIKVKDEGDNQIIHSAKYTVGPASVPRVQERKISEADTEMTVITIQSPGQATFGKQTPTTNNMPVYVNAGLVHENGSLVGATVQNIVVPNQPGSHEISVVDPSTAAGKNFAGNNGVLGFEKNNGMALFRYDDAELPQTEFEWAFQNGPILLLENVNLHDAANTEKQENRSGMGFNSNGNLVYIKSEKETSLHEFANLFSAYDVSNAIYLDGGPEDNNGFELLTDQGHTRWSDDGVGADRIVLQFFRSEVSINVINKPAS